MTPSRPGEYGRRVAARPRGGVGRRVGHGPMVVGPRERVRPTRQSALERVEDEPDHERAEDATTSAAMKPWTWPKPSCWASQPPMTPPRMPTTMFGQAAAGGPTADERAGDRAGEEADDDPAEEAHVSMAVSLASADASSPPGTSRTAVTKARGACGGPRAWRPSISTTRPSASRASRASVAVAERRQARRRRAAGGPAGGHAPSVSSDAVGIPLGVELADDRVGGRDPQRPDRVRAIGRRAPASSMPTTRVMNVARSASRIAGREVRRQLGVEARRVVAARRAARGALVGDDAADRGRSAARRPSAHPAAVRVPEDVGTGAPASAASASATAATSSNSRSIE